MCPADSALACQVIQTYLCGVLQWQTDPKAMIAVVTYENLRLSSQATPEGKYLYPAPEHRPSPKEGDHVVLSRVNTGEIAADFSLKNGILRSLFMESELQFEEVPHLAAEVIEEISEGKYLLVLGNRNHTWHHSENQWIHGYSTEMISFAKKASEHERQNILNTHLTAVAADFQTRWDLLDLIFSEKRDAYLGEDRGFSIASSTIADQRKLAVPMFVQFLENLYRQPRWQGITFVLEVNHEKPLKDSMRPVVPTKKPDPRRTPVPPMPIRDTPAARNKPLAASPQTPASTAQNSSSAPKQSVGSNLSPCTLPPMKFSD